MLTPLVSESTPIVPKSAQESALATIYVLSALGFTLGTTFQNFFPEPDFAGISIPLLSGSGSAILILIALSAYKCCKSKTENSFFETKLLTILPPAASWALGAAAETVFPTYGPIVAGAFMFALLPALIWKLKSSFYFSYTTPLDKESQPERDCPLGTCALTICCE